MDPADKKSTSTALFARASYERRYERSSESMMEDLREGSIKETGDICTWALVWQTLKRLEEKTPTTGTS